MREWLRYLLDRWRAWRRGEERIAPRGVRGRVYAPKQSTQALPGVHARTRLKGTMSLRVWREKEQCWYKVDPKSGAQTKE